MKILLKCCLQFLAMLLLLSRAAMSMELPTPLVTADWLSENRNKVVILDVRKDLDGFEKEGHIENAILVDSKKVRVTRTINGVEVTRMLPDRKNFEDFMSAHGVSNDSAVVITHKGESAGNVTGAARLYWQLRYYGFSNVALLDGGNAAWVAALEDLVSQPTTFKQGTFTVSGEHPEILATLEDVRKVLKKGGATLVDTRSLRFHIGLEKRDYVYAYGHIPGSYDFPYKFMHPKKGAATFLPVERQKQTFKDLHIDSQAPLIVYCNSAYEASSVWFLLHELMGNRSVKVYDGSLHEWTMDKSNPMTSSLTVSQ